MPFGDNLKYTIFFISAITFMYKCGVSLNEGYRF